MSAADFNKRELEQGRLSLEQLAVMCEYSNPAKLKTNLSNGALTWPRVAECVREYQKKRGLSADGMAGENTRKRIKLGDQAAVVDVVPIDRPVNGIWPTYDGPAVVQPRNRKEIYAIFGDPGSITENKAWSRANLMDCHEREGNRLPGVPAKYWVTVHRVVEPYLREALRRTQIIAPDFVIEVLGCHNWRPIRHKVGNPLSLHSWAIAVDITPKVNRGIDVKKGQAPQAWTPEWDKMFPPDPRRLTKEVIQSFSSCGFAWGADWDEDGLTLDETWLDTMHLEWIARAGSNILV